MKKLLKNFERQSIGKSLKNTFKYILIAYIITMGAAFALIINLYWNLQEFNSTMTNLSLESWNVRYSILDAQSKMYKVCLEPDVNKQKELVAQTDELDMAVQKSLKIILDSSQKNKQHVVKVQELLQTAFTFRSTALLYSSQNQMEKAVDLLEGSYFPIIDQIIEELEVINTNVGNQMSESVENNRIKVGIILIILALITVVCVIVVLRIRKRTIKILLQPLLEVGTAMEEMAEGNLDFRLSYESKNEIGLLAEKVRETGEQLKNYIENIDYTLKELAGKNYNISIETEYKGLFGNIKLSMEEIVMSLNNMIWTIRNISDEFQNDSVRLLSISKELNEGTANQSSDIEELSAAMGQINLRTNANAAVAKKVFEHAGDTLDIVQQGNKHMEQMIDIMDEIRRSSKEISNILSLIQGISDQTHLLALNASIEAARAGKAGKGFSVVANEIRNLADETNIATNTTEKLISNCTTIIESGKKIADDTAGILSKVAESSENILEITKQISDESENQVVSLQSLDNTVKNITSIVFRNSEIADKVEKESRKLGTGAEELTASLHEFKLSL